MHRKIRALAVRERQTLALSCTAAQILSHTLRRKHQGKVPVHQKLAVFVVPVQKLLFIELQRRCVSQYALFFPEIYCLIIPGIKRMVCHTELRKAQTLQSAVGFQVSHQKALHPTGQPLSYLCLKAFRNLSSCDMRGQQIQLLLVFVG